MANVFFTPHKVIVGEGALKESQASLCSLGKKALIVTSGSMVRGGVLEKLKESLRAGGCDCAVFTDITGEPSDQMVEAGAAIYRAEGCDFLIGVGGGSPIDAMKAIAMVVCLGGSINDYYGKVITEPLPPFCAIPSTAGTGSEATQFTIINNTVDNIKMLLKGPSLMPTLAVVDPALSVTTPPKVTAFTGLDALCHAVEACPSKEACPLADTMALSAVRRIFASLRRCYEQGDDLAARADMAQAALEAGMAFNNSSVTIIHGMSRPIGALFHVPHGLSNAMLIKPCLTFALPGCFDRFAVLAKEIGVWKEGMSEQEGAEAFLAAVEALCEALQIPSCKEYGLDQEAFFAAIPKMAADAQASGSPANTRRAPSVEEMEALYRTLF